MGGQQETLNTEDWPEINAILNLSIVFVPQRLQDGHLCRIILVYLPGGGAKAELLPPNDVNVSHHTQGDKKNTLKQGEDGVPRKKGNQRSRVLIGAAEAAVWHHLSLLIAPSWKQQTASPQVLAPLHR